MADFLEFFLPLGLQPGGWVLKQKFKKVPKESKKNSRDIKLATLVNTLHQMVDIDKLKHAALGVLGVVLITPMLLFSE